MIAILQLLAQALVILIVVRSLLSWFPSINRGTGAVRLIFQATDPILRPIQRVLPTPGGIDFSPLVAIVVLQLIAQSLARR